MSSTLRDCSAAELFDWIKRTPRAWHAGLAVLVVSEWISAGRSTYYYMRHRSVAAALANSDECAGSTAWRALSPESLESATAAEGQQAAQRDAVCKGLLAANAQRDEVASYTAKCAEVVRHMKEGKITDADRVALRQAPVGSDVSAFLDGEPAVAMADRIAKKDLIPSDVSGTRFPCGPDARVLLLQAAAASQTMWGSLPDASADRGLLLAMGARATAAEGKSTKVVAFLTADSKAALHKNAEDSAAKKRGARTSIECEPTIGLCELDVGFGWPQGPNCTVLLRVSVNLKKGEEAASRAAQNAEDAKGRAEIARTTAQEAADQAKRARCDGIRGHRMDCFLACTDNPEHDTDACDRRCGGDTPIPGCD